jgi:hypothetical protein
MNTRDRIKKSLQEIKAKKQAIFEEFRNVMLIAVDFSYLSDPEVEVKKAFEEFKQEKEMWRIIDWLEHKAPYSKKDELIWVVSQRGIRVWELEERIRSLEERINLSITF